MKNNFVSHKSIKKDKHSPFFIDVVLLMLLGILLFYIAQKYDAFELIVDISRKYEEYEVDEIITLLVITSFMLMVMNYRRTQRLKKEIIRRKQAEAEIKKIAFCDCLTGLPNRALCMDRLEHLLNQYARKADSFAILFVDLDDFKKVNDTYGHDGGDALLKQFATRLLGQLRKGDTLSRFAGDEFIILFESVDSRRNVTIFVQKILDCLKQPFKIGDNCIQAGISIGIATYPNDGRDAETLLKHADIAMYQAKSEGKNTFKFYCSAPHTLVQNKF